MNNNNDGKFADFLDRIRFWIKKHNIDINEVLEIDIDNTSQFGFRMRIWNFNCPYPSDQDLMEINVMEEHKTASQQNVTK
jgi:hypothetical protein